MTLAIVKSFPNRCPEKDLVLLAGINAADKLLQWQRLGRRGGLVTAAQSKIARRTLLAARWGEPKLHYTTGCKCRSFALEAAITERLWVLGRSARRERLPSASRIYVVMDAIRTIGLGYPLHSSAGWLLLWPRTTSPVFNET